MTSCGAMASISAAMLRHIGYEVKLIHGEVPESVDHAWISVFDDANRKWIPYDPTRFRSNGIYDLKTTPTYRVKATCNKWEDIRDIIEADHVSYRERDKARRQTLK